MSAYRDDLFALSARHDALSNELEAKTREVSDAARLLEEARTRAKLPVLDNIRVASPCSAEWNAMTGDERVRACGDCNKNVYNLSGMTRDEAQSLIVEKEGKLCVRYFQRTDGTILLKDCVIGVRRKRRRRIVAVGAAAMLAAGGGFVYRALLGDGAQMGDLAVDPGSEPRQVLGEWAPPVTAPEPDLHEVRGRISLDRQPDVHEVTGGISIEAVHEHSDLRAPRVKAAPKAKTAR